MPREGKKLLQYLDSLIVNRVCETIYDDDSGSNDEMDETSAPSSSSDCDYFTDLFAIRH